MKQILNTIVIATIILCNLTTKGQQYTNCDHEDIISTDPNSYNHRNDPNELLKWDWTGDVDYTFHVKTSPTTHTTLTIKSPFYFSPNPSSQNNITHFRLQNDKDYEPIDGWELIYKNFGNCCNWDDAVADPSFALYNKYTGVLRFFMYVQSPLSAYNGARIKLSYSSQSTKIAYNLNDNLNKQPALDKQIHSIVAEKINYFSNEFGYWLHADFPITYDPCVCEHFTILNIEPSLIVSGDLEIEIVGKATQEVVKNGIPSSSSSDLNNIFSNATSAISAGNAKQKTWNDFFTGIDNTVNTLNNALSNDINNDQHKFPEWLKMVPEVGKYIGLIEYFTGGGGNSPKPIAPLSFDVSLKSTNSTLQFAYPINSYDFYTPGSDHLSYPQNIAPIYDEPLGIFNLLETPKLEFYKIAPTPSFLNGPSSVLDPYFLDKNLGRV
jgi:hypothetical protein